jgi:hypothetical protein
MTLWDGHGRTPHDTLENIQATIAMIFCLPCLCVVGCSEKLSGRREEDETVIPNVGEDNRLFELQKSPV